MTEKNIPSAPEKTPEKKTSVTPLEIADLSAKAAYDRKAENLIRLDMTGLSSESDHYLICTGLSEPHLGAIAERIQREVRNQLGVRPLAVDGTPKSHWMIVDYGSVMIHILTEDARMKYQLESLWGDAPKTDIAARLDAEAEKRRLHPSS